MKNVYIYAGQLYRKRQVNTNFTYAVDIDENTPPFETINEPICKEYMDYQVTPMMERCEETDQEPFWRSRERQNGSVFGKKSDH